MKKLRMRKIKGTNERYALDGPELVDGSFGVFGEGRRSEDPDVAGGELDRGRATAEREESESEEGSADEPGLAICIQQKEADRWRTWRRW